MAQSSTVSMIGRLKDQRVDVSERLEVAQKLWLTENAVGPNKHQAVMDTIINILMNNRKRHELNCDLEREVWQTLSSFLNSKGKNQSSAKQSTFTFRPAIAQILVDTLETEGKKRASIETGDTLSCVLDCCNCILQSPTLAGVLTSRLDTLVSLCSVLCQIAVALPADHTSLRVLPLLSQLTTHLWQHHHRSQFTPSQVLQVVSEKLLLPVMKLSYLVHNENSFTDLTCTANSLEDFLLATLIHESQQKLFKVYLDGVAKKEEASQVPWVISNVFSKITTGFHQYKDDEEESSECVLHRRVVLHFLPRFFQHAVKMWRRNGQLSFELFVHLNSYLGVPVEKQTTDQQGSKVAMETDCMGTVCEMLFIIREQGVYNVAADRTGDGVQLHYFRHLLNMLMQSPMCEESCRCLLELLNLNHLILEPVMLAVLHCCCSNLAQMSEQCRATVDMFLSEMVSTYSLLHQVPHYYSFLLHFNTKSPQQLLDSLSLPHFSQQLCTTVMTLTDGTAVELWRRLQEEVVLISQRILEEQPLESDEERLWCASLLLHQHLQNHSCCGMVGRVMDKAMLLLSQLESKLVSCLLHHIQQSSKEKLCRSLLLLAVCLGEKKLLMTQYEISHFSMPTSKQLPFSATFSDGVTTGKKSSVFDAVARFLEDALTVQKFELLESEGVTVDWSQLVAGLPDGDRLTQTQWHCQWDGTLSGVNEDTYVVAKLHLLIHCPLLLPVLLQQHAAWLAQLVVRTLAHSKPHDTRDSKSKSLQSVAKELLLQPAVAHSEEFTHTLMCTMWQHFAAADSLRLPSSAVLTALRGLGDVHINWTDVSDRAVKSVTASVQELLTCPSRQELQLSGAQTALLQALQQMPLAHLAAGTRLQCTLGLLLIICHQDRSCWSAKRKESKEGQGQDMADLLCKLLTVQLENSVGTSLLQCLPPRVLLQCLFNMAVQCEMLEDCPVEAMLKKTVMTVMGDFHSVLHLHDFITDVEVQLKKVCRQLTTRTVTLSQSPVRALLTLTHCVLSETHRYLKKDFFRQDVQSACRQHFTRLSAAVDCVVDVDSCQEHQSPAMLHPVVLRCFTAVTLQRCVDAADGKKDLEPKQQQMIQSVLHALSITKDYKQRAQSLTEELAFVRCLYHQYAVLSTVLTPHITHTLCTALLQHLFKCKAGPDRKKEYCADNTQDSSQLTNGKRQRHATATYSGVSKVQKVHSKQSLTSAREHRDKMQPVVSGPVTSKDCRGRGRGRAGCVQHTLTDCGGEEDQRIMDTLTQLLTACPISLFSQLLQQLLTSMKGPVHQAVDSVLVWQNVVGCHTLTVEQRNLLESLSLTVLQQCVQIMQQVHSCPDQLALDLGLAVLQCLASMLSKHKLLSSKGTMLCLLCVNLVPLQQVKCHHFLQLLPAVCDVLHGVLLHHPRTAVRLLEDCLAVAASVLKECIRHGDQKFLLENTGYIKPMTNCAELIHRLLTLLMGHQMELQRVVATLVSDYTNAVKSLTLLPDVKKPLVSAMYACLDVCDKHAISQLRQRLVPGVREVFHMLHNDYIRYHKYTGKV